MNKNIIIAILAIIIIAGAAAFIFGQSNGKTDTQINFLGEKTLQNGEQLEFELKDAQGNAIAGQTVNITFGDEKYQLTTDENGKGQITVDGEEAGSYEVTVDYGGNDKYNGCTGKVTITITDGTADNPASQTNSSSSVNTNNDTRPAVDSGGITREEADKYGYTYTPDHGGHYIGKNDHWDENAGKYHD